MTDSTQLRVNGPREPIRCHGCGLYMSWREEDEQGMCNECLAGYSYAPR